MEIDSFEIRLYLIGHPKKYRIKVDVISKSDRILRFKVTGGNKSFELEKLLFRKSNQWKIRSNSFTNVQKKNPKEIEVGVKAISEAIDRHLKYNKI